MPWLMGRVSTRKTSFSQTNYRKHTRDVKDQFLKHKNDYFINISIAILVGMRQTKAELIKETQSWFTKGISIYNSQTHFLF